MYTCDLPSPTPPSPQVSLLNAAKDVANALVVVLEPAKTAAGKSPSDPAVQEVKAKAAVSHVTVM